MINEITISALKHDANFGFRSSYGNCVLHKTQYLDPKFSQTGEIHEDGLIVSPGKIFKQMPLDLITDKSLRRHESDQKKVVQVKPTTHISCFWFTY